MVISSIHKKSTVIVALTTWSLCAAAAPGPEYTYRLLYELTKTEFQRVNRLCGIAFNDEGHAAWIRSGITLPDGTSDPNVRQLWFHDGTQARLLWSSTAANWVPGQDEFYPDCSGTGNPSGGSTVALNDDDLLVVHVEVRSGAPSSEPGQDPPEFLWIDAKQDPASVLRTAQAMQFYTPAINLNAAGQIGIGAVTNGGTSDAGWLLTATDGVASQSGGFVHLESSWQRGALINDTGWVVSSFGAGGGCPTNDTCAVLVSVFDTTRNDALRLRSIAVGPGSAWMGGGGVQRSLGFNNRGLVSVQGQGNSVACYAPRLSVFDVGLSPREYPIAGVGTAIQMQEPGYCSSMLVSGSAMNDWNHVVFGADTWPDGTNNRQIWLGDVGGNPLRRIIPLGTTSDPTAELDVGGGRAIWASTNPWIGPESLNGKGQAAINVWFAASESGSGTQQGILVATPCEGCSPGNPALPIEALPVRGWRFEGCRWTVEGGAVTPGQAVQCGAWQDPALAIGYDFEVEGDGPPFATVMVPVPLPGGDGAFTVEFGGGTHPLEAGQVFRFADYVPGGVRAFRISGIDLEEALDPSDPTAFVTRVTHVASTDLDFTITMIPITQNDTPLASFSLSSTLVAGCKKVTGTVSLSEPAPAAGAIVTISDTLAAALPPATLKFLPGEVTRKFTMKTVAVAEDTTGDVSVTLGPQTLSRPLTLRRIGLYSLSVSPTTIVGGAGAAGVARLECAAGPGPITVNLSSSDPSVAEPTAASIEIPAGATSGGFAVQTRVVLASASPKVLGNAGGLTRSRTIRVVPAASVSPPSLKFGSVPAGQTSAPLSATLTNRGAAAFSLISVGLTGTAGSWFAQESDCPASLPAGASCTVSVTFTPLAASSKSAKLSIATSATSTPLTVSLSGTGL